MLTKMADGSSRVRALTPVVLFAAGVFFGWSLSRALNLQPEPAPVAAESPAAGWKREVDSSAVASIGAPRQMTASGDSGSQWKRRNLGEAVLDSDVPALQKLRDQAVQAGLSYAMQHRGPDYENLFRSYGFDDETSKRMMGHVAAIFEAKSLLQANASQLNHARMAYEREMKMLLGPAISEYFRHEAISSAGRQLEDYRSFANASGLTLGESEKVAVRDLIHDFDAYTEKTLTEAGGVYQNWPMPSYGDEAKILSAIQGDLLERRMHQMLAQAEQRGISPEIRKSLAEYYAKGVSVYRDFAQGASPEQVREKRALEAYELEMARAKARAKKTEKKQ